MLDDSRVARHRFGASLGGLSFQKGLRLGAVAIEFFFEGRTLR